MRRGRRADASGSRAEAAFIVPSSGAYYVSGLGEVKEKVVKGHHEEFQLVSVTH
jgi:hypothetical protein